MVRTSIVLLLLALLIGLLLYFRVPPASVLRARQFVGVQSCKGCHATPASGDQFGTWRSSAHATAFAALRSDSAIQYAHQHQSPTPDTDPECLRCHTTGYGTAAGEHGPSYRQEEGVTCEACHGAAGDYSIYAAMRDSKVFVKLGGRRGSERYCLQCHAASLSDAHCPFQHEPFAARTAMRAIAHPLPKKTAAR